MSGPHNPFIHRKKRKWHSIKQTLILGLQNLLTRTKITDPTGPVVCLTSHGARVRNAHITIESIANGRQKPSRLIMWLDEEEAGNPLPNTIKRLQRRGLEVRAAPRRGPHNKYFAYLSTSNNLDVALVTADDDVIYPEWWLKTLYTAHNRNPDQIHCLRAHRLTFHGTRVAPYNQWPECETTTPSILNFATGVSGVIYPAAFQRELKSAGEAFMDCAPKADDVWLHAMAVRGSWPVHQIYAKAIHFEEVRANRQIALHTQNVGLGGNDLQISKTYSVQELEKLRQANTHEGP